MAIVICPDCGKEQDNLNKFCRNCGADLSKVEVVEESIADSPLESNASPSGLDNVNIEEKVDDVVSAGVEKVDDVVPAIEDTVSDTISSSEDTVDDVISSSEETVADVVPVGGSQIEKAESSWSEEKIGEAGNVKKCANCGAELNSNVRFCPVCGNPVEDLNNSRSLKFCPSCGTELNPNVKFCPNCGLNLAHPTANPEPTRNHVAEVKTPILSVLLSFLFPGLGQFYNGQSTKGLYYIILAIVSWILCFFLIGIVLYLLVWVWSMYDAYQSAEAINRGEVLEDKLF